MEHWNSDDMKQKAIEGVPEITTGTEKQIEWARRIRFDNLNQAATLLDKTSELIKKASGKRKERMEKLIEKDKSSVDVLSGTDAAAIISWFKSS